MEGYTGEVVGVYKDRVHNGHEEGWSSALDNLVALFEQAGSTGQVASFTQWTQRSGRAQWSAGGRRIPVIL